MFILTQDKIAFFVSLIIFFSAIIIMTCFFYYYHGLPKALFILPFILGAISFISNKYYVETFFYHKIKTLYNTMLSVKKSENKIDIKNPKLIEEIVGKEI